MHATLSLKKLQPNTPSRSAGIAAIVFQLALLCLPRRGLSQETNPRTTPHLRDWPVTSYQMSPTEEARSWLAAGDRAREYSYAGAAIECYEKALRAFRTMSDHSREAITLNDLGLVYDSLSQHAKAIGFYEQALAIRHDHDRVGEVETLNNLGHAYNSLSQYEKAIGLLEKALAICRKAGDRVGEGETLNNLGQAYNSLSQYPKAIALYEPALVIQREVGDHAGECETLNKLGEVYRSLSQYAKAIEYYEQALAIVVNDRSKEGDLRNGLGPSTTSISQYANAIGLYDHFRRNAARSRSREGAILNNLGAAATSMSQYAKAIGFYERALAIEREIGDSKGEGTTLNNIGGIYYFLTQYTKAIAFYEQALAIRRATGDRAGEGATLSNLGSAYNSLSHQTKAIDFYEQALAITREVGNRAGEGIILNNLGGIHSRLDQNAKAVGFYEQALAIRRAIGDRAGEGATLNNLGLAYDSLSQRTKAIDFYEQALSILREVGDRAGEAVTLMNLMLTLASEQRPSLAILFGKQAVNAYQQIRQDLGGLDEDIRKTYLESNESTYRRLADLLLAQDRIAEAQQVLNLLKEEEFFDFIRRDSAQSSSLTGRAELTAREGDWNRQYNEIAGQLTELGHERGELFVLQIRTAEQEERLKKLDEKLSIAGEAFQRFLDQLETESSHKELSKEKLGHVKDSQALMQTLRELGSNTVVVYTLVTEKKLRLILITPDVLKTAETAIKRVDLNKKIVAFRQSLENSHSDPLRLAHEMYTLILGPIEKDLAGAKAETIMWSLDGALRYLPVAALHDGKQYLVERFRNVVFTPARDANLKDVPEPQWRALGLGVSKAYKGFDALPGARKELEGIIHDEATGTHGVLPGTIRLDDAFTEESMRAGLLQHYRVVHIASHFRFKPGNETDSYLLLGDGGHMSLADMGKMMNPFAGVDLLTLSACDTASGGTDANGKEVEGFAVLAQRQGAKAVIATLWPVADESTNELMQTFYRIRESKSGTTKTEALQQAQLALLRGSNYSHPYYWAPFILIGNWR
jgi:CHAT domain-containing protein/Tfp pilus assembly protein PilF